MHDAPIYWLTIRHMTEGTRGGHLAEIVLLLELLKHLLRGGRIPLEAVVLHRDSVCIQHPEVIL